MNQLDRQYQDLLFKLIADGSVKETRNGKTISVFGQQIRHKMSDGFPLLTTKKMYWKGIVTELLWFLRGDTNIKYLVDNDCHIWDGDAYKKYHSTWEMDTYGVLDALSQEEFINRIKTDTEFAKTWGDLGPVYGRQWRKWNKIRFRDINRINQHHNQIAGIENPFEEEGKWVRGYEDQIANLINELKTNPDSRRLMVSAWNVAELESMTLPPCHYGFQVYTRELSFDERHLLYCKSFEGASDTHKGSSDIDKMTEYHNNRNIPTRAISLMWNQRSVDVPLGLPFNIASYGLLLEILAKMTNMVPDELIGNLGDCHIYENQLPGCREQIPREPFALPKLSINDTYWVTSDDAHEYTLDTEILSMLIEDFKIEAYESHPAIKFPLSN
jgi:thymidylate synthase